MSEFKVVRPRLADSAPLSQSKAHSTATKIEPSVLSGAMVADQKPLTPTDVQYLQRTIGNAATVRLLAVKRKGDLTQASDGAKNHTQKKAHPISEDTPVIGARDTVTAHQGAALAIQRFPLAQQVRDRSDKASNEQSTGKALIEWMRDEQTIYKDVIQGVEQYNANVKRDLPFKLTDRDAEANKLLYPVLQNIQNSAQNYLAKHDLKDDRPRTVDSFRKLVVEIDLERTAIAVVAKSNQHSPHSSGTWGKAIQMELVGMKVVNADLIQLAADLSLPIAFLSTISPETLEFMNLINSLLRKGDTKLANQGFSQLNDLLPGKTGMLVRSSMMRRHLGIINPALNKAIMDPKFKQKNKKSKKLGNDALMAGDANNESAIKYLKNFQGTENWEATPERVKKAAGEDEGVTRGVRTEDEFIANFEARRLWEKENVDLKTYSKLKPYEQGAISGYSLNFHQFNDPLRDDLTPMEHKLGFNSGTQAMVENLISALNKLPPYTQPVYRHDTDFPGFMEMNRVGATVSDMALLSSTREAGSLKKIEGSGIPDVLSVLVSKTGRFIKPLSNFNQLHKLSKDENEVLFKPGTRFKIVQRIDGTPNAAGGFDFPLSMPAYIRGVLNQDAERKTIKIVLVKEEV